MIYHNFLMKRQKEIKMNLEKIRSTETKKIGKKLEYFEKISSTHKYAKEIAMQRDSDGKLIIAEIQTDGIGTKGRIWYTGENKNIAMTMILKPQCKISKLEGLTLQIAECMKKTIYDLYQIQLKIKKPNDLILNNKKICGILTEINTISEKINYLIISLGFNVNEDNFSEETQDIATSLKKEYNQNFEREEIIKKFIEILEEEIEL